jgi:hypothetical protein
MARRKKIVTIKLTEDEALGLMRAGNAGIADLHDDGSDEALDAADHAGTALDRLGRAMAEAWPDDA